MIAMVNWPTWCAPEFGESAEFPLVSRGGAGYSFPWQASGEWLRLLNACELRCRFDTERECTIRPTIRLQAVG